MNPRWTALENIFRTGGFGDFRWFDPKEIIVAQWVRMKCIYGCGNYGKNAACPPAVPTIPECKRFFKEYAACTIIRKSVQLEEPESRHEIFREINLRLFEVEKAVFLSGFERAFMLMMDSCTLCGEPCTGVREDCRAPRKARPTPEAMGVDVYRTVAKAGFPIAVRTEVRQAMNRYAFLMVE
jgi:predicted metal-binding protein